MCGAQVERHYTGPQADNPLVDHMKAGNAKGPLVVQIAKLVPKPDCSAFDAFGRILSGTVRVGDQVGLTAPGTRLQHAFAWQTTQDRFKTRRSVPCNLSA